MIISNKTYNWHEFCCIVGNIFPSTNYFDQFCCEDGILQQIHVIHEDLDRTNSKIDPWPTKVIFQKDNYV